MSMEQFHSTVKASGKCIYLGTEDLKCGMSTLCPCDAASVASSVAVGGGSDTQMALVLMKKMTHCDQMSVITKAGQWLFRSFHSLPLWCSGLSVEFKLGGCRFPFKSLPLALSKSFVLGQKIVEVSQKHMGGKKRKEYVRRGLTNVIFSK